VEDLLLNTLLLNTFKIFGYILSLLLLAFVARQFLSDSPREDRKKTMGRLAKKDRWRRKWDRFLGRE